MLASAYQRFIAGFDLRVRNILRASEVATLDRIALRACQHRRLLA